MKKRLGLVLILLLLLVGSTLALAASGGFNVTLLVAQERALDNDLQPILDELDIEDKVDALADAQEDADDIDYIVGLPETRLKDKFIKFVYPLQAEMNLELAQRQERDHQSQLTIDVEKAYQSIWLIQKELEKEQKKLEISQVEHHAQEIRFQNKQITATALASSQYNLENQQLSVRETEYKLKKAQYDLNQLMGQPLENYLIIEDDITLHSPTDLDLELDLELVFEQSLAVNTSFFQKEMSAELTDLKWQYTAEEYSEITDNYQDAWYARELARIELVETRENIWLALTRDYHQLLNDIDGYTLQKQAVELKQKEYEVACAQYELGKISKLSLLQSEQKWIEAQYTLNVKMISLTGDWQSFCQQYAVNQ